MSFPAMPLAQEELQAGHDVPIHGDRHMAETSALSTEQANADKFQVVEHLRSGLGRLISGIGHLGQ